MNLVACHCFHGPKSVAELKRPANQLIESFESPFPRPQIRGRIEAIVAGWSQSYPVVFPRPQIRGRIEAADTEV